jgi:hypothetical protein
MIDSLAMLHRHGVAHIFNSRTHKVASRLTIPDPSIDQSAVCCRSLSVPPNCPHGWAKVYLQYLPSYLYFGNELEGCALHTIADVLEAALDAA